MPFKRYDSQVWWVSFTCSDGSRIRRSTGTTSKKEAEALELKWKLEVFQEKQWEKQPDRLFEELLVAYLHAHQDKKSAGRDISAAKHLRRVFEGKILASFCAQDVRAYIECRQELVKAATINRELCLLSTSPQFWKTGAGMGYSQSRFRTEVEAARRPCAVDKQSGSIKLAAVRRTMALFG